MTLDRSHSDTIGRVANKVRVEGGNPPSSLTSMFRRIALLTQFLRQRFFFTFIRTQFFLIFQVLSNNFGISSLSLFCHQPMSIHFRKRWRNRFSLSYSNQLQFQSIGWRICSNFRVLPSLPFNWKMDSKLLCSAAYSVCHINTY